MSLLLSIPTLRVHEEEMFAPSEIHGARVNARHSRHDTGTLSQPTELFLAQIVNESGTWRATHMRMKQVTDPDTSAKELLDEARSKGKTSQYYCGSDLVGLKWDTPCYLQLVLDFDKSEFMLDEERPDLDPIQFRRRKPVLEGRPLYKYYDPNHSFFDGEIADVLGRSGFRCVNYLTDESGNELQYPQSRVYGFEIRYIAEWRDGSRKPHDIDPDGQNQGPPPQPLDGQHIQPVA